MNNYEFKRVIDNMVDISSVFGKYDKYHVQDIKMFKQTWSSTALGFDIGNIISGQAFTTAWTIVVQALVGDKELWFVFFNGRIAYVVNNPTDEFFEDLKTEKMVYCSEAQERY